MNDNSNLVSDELKLAIARFAEYLRADLDKFHGDSEYGKTSTDYWTADEPGKNVVRIIHADRSGSHRSSYCFVVLRDGIIRGKQWKAGDILMCAGWKAPAFNQARGNILTNDYRGCRWAGPGYLR
jgi:hypothetical protein